MSAASNLEPTAEQLSRAVRARGLPGMPERLSDPRGRLERARPSQSLEQSYVTQQYVMSGGSRRWLLRAHAVSPSAAAPLDLPAHLLSAWSPGGADSTLGECLEAQDRLRAAVKRCGGTARDAVAKAADGSWLEATLVVHQLDDDRARSLGEEFGQAAVVRWDSGALHVLPTGVRDDVVPSQSSWLITELVGRSCPIRLDDDPTGRCVQYGGPFGSAAIHAAALWAGHRRLGVRLLGCDPCRDGSEPAWGTPGGAFSLSDLVLGSRYGSWTWRP